MRITLWLSVLVALLLVNNVYASNSKDKTLSPTTKLEEFTAKTGVVIVKGFEEVDTVDGLYDTSITIKAQEFSNLSTNKKEYGITITVKEESGRYDKEHTSYIDYDEIDSLLKGIDYISKINKSATKLSNIQADYKTKGLLSISTFSSEEKIMVAISSGIIGKVTAFCNTSSLYEIIAAIKTAKQKIESIKN